MDHNVERANYWLRVAGASALATGALFLLVGVAVGLRSYHYIGTGTPASNTISVSGEGEVFAVPDTAIFTFTVQEIAKDVTSAQDAASKKSNDAIAYLKQQGIDEKDIQTTDYNVYPQYEYSQGVCASGYCPGGKQTLTGYQVSQTVTVKVRDTKKAGTLLSGIGARGISQVSGLSFTVADQKLLESQARAKAIKDARAKADVLARDLGVTIVRVVGFNEGGGGYPGPIAYGMTMGADASRKEAAPPEIPTGQNKITSNVSITYEIR